MFIFIPKRSGLKHCFYDFVFYLNTLFLICL